jgi:adenylate kinase family enzyme
MRLCGKNPMSSFFYCRIVVIIGTTSSGKSTLAEQLAERWDMDFIELDALHWEPNWQEAPLDVFRARVEEATQAEQWVVAGNYHLVRDQVWPKAEAVIWLDYSLMRFRHPRETEAWWERL